MDSLFNIDFGNNFKTVIEDIINNLFNTKKDTNTILNISDIKHAKEEVKDFIIKSNCDPKKCNEILISKGYEEEKIKFLISVLKKQRDELLYSTLVHFNSGYGETVTKFNWTLKLIYGTSELTKLKYPVLQLALSTVSNGEHRQVAYDISKPMLSKIINQLENIDKL